MEAVRTGGNTKAKPRKWYWNYQTIEKNVCLAKDELSLQTSGSWIAMNHSIWLYKDTQTTESSLDA